MTEKPKKVEIDRSNVDRRNRELPDRRHGRDPNFGSLFDKFGIEDQRERSVRRKSSDRRHLNTVKLSV
jgi:hypothetical protein